MSVSSPSSAPSEEDNCEENIAELEKKFKESWLLLVRLIHENWEKSGSTTCDEVAKASLEATTLDMVASKEHAADKIERSEKAVANVRPVLQQMHVVVQTIEEHLAQLQQMCDSTEKITYAVFKLGKFVDKTEECTQWEDGPPLPAPEGTAENLISGTALEEQQTECYGGERWTKPEPGHVLGYLGPLVGPCDKPNRCKVSDPAYNTVEKCMEQCMVWNKVRGEAQECVAINWTGYFNGCLFQGMRKACHLKKEHEWRLEPKSTIWRERRGPCDGPIGNAGEDFPEDINGCEGCE